MLDIVGYIVIVLFLGACIYGLVLQIKETIAIRSSKKSSRRVLAGNLICSISYLGFIIFFVINILSAIKIIQISEDINRNISIGCWVFVMGILGGKYCIVPKIYK